MSGFPISLFTSCCRQKPNQTADRPEPAPETGRHSQIGCKALALAVGMVAVGIGLYSLGGRAVSTELALPQNPALDFNPFPNLPLQPEVTAPLLSSPVISTAPREKPDYFLKAVDALNEGDAKKFFEKLEKDPSFRFQIAHARTEEEQTQIIREKHHLHFDEKEFHSAFQEKYHCPLKKSELHKLVSSGLMTSEVAAKLPYTKEKPHHGE